VGLALCCRREGRLFLALTEATFGVNNPTIWGRATAARDTGDLGDGITNHSYGGPRKNTFVWRISWQKSYCLLPIMSASSPAYSRRASDLSRKPSLAEAGGSASKDAKPLIGRTSAPIAGLPALSR